MKSKRIPQTLPTEEFILGGDGERIFRLDAVRIGNGAVMWTVTGWDDSDRTVTLRDDLTARTRRIDRGRIVLSAHENPNWF